MTKGVEEQRVHHGPWGCVEIELSAGYKDRWTGEYFTPESLLSASKIPLCSLDEGFKKFKFENMLCAWPLIIH